MAGERLQPLASIKPRIPWPTGKMVHILQRVKSGCSTRNQARVHPKKRNPRGVRGAYGHGQSTHSVVTFGWYYSCRPPSRQAGRAGPALQAAGPERQAGALRPSVIQLSLTHFSVSSHFHTQRRDSPTTTQPVPVTSSASASSLAQSGPTSVGFHPRLPSCSSCLSPGN